MCLGIPVQILECGAFTARCLGPRGEVEVDLLLVVVTAYRVETAR